MSARRGKVAHRSTWNICSVPNSFASVNLVSRDHQRSQREAVGVPFPLGGCNADLHAEVVDVAVVDHHVPAAAGRVTFENRGDQGLHGLGVKHVHRALPFGTCARGRIVTFVSGRGPNFSFSHG